MAKSPIGIVGLGPLQIAMARRLAGDGARVLVHDLRPEERKPLVSGRPRIEIAGSLADIGAECATVITNIDTLDGLMAAIFGTEDRTGFARELAPGSLIIEMSPGSPRHPPRLQGALGPHAIAVVDARVLTGGPDEALIGTLGIALGGYIDFVERAADLLAPLGRIERTGSLGSARTAAITTALMRARLQLAEREATTLAEAAGLSPAVIGVLRDAARGTAASLPMAETTRLLTDIHAGESLAAELGVTSAAEANSPSEGIRTLIRSELSKHGS